MFRLQKERVKKDNILFSGGSIQQVFQSLIVLQVQPDPRTQHISKRTIFKLDLYALHS